MTKKDGFFFFRERDYPVSRKQATVIYDQGSLRQSFEQPGLMSVHTPSIFKTKILAVTFNLFGLVNQIT